MRLPIVDAEAFVLNPTKGIDDERLKEHFPWHFNPARQAQTKRTASSPTWKDDFHVTERLARLWGR